MIATGSWNNQDMIRFLNSEDMISQINFYVVDIV